MAGIISYGSYVPYRRLKRSAISAALGVPAAKGERAVASFDEDSVSMAVEAARDALRNAPQGAISALFFATTSPPFAEKLSAATVGAAALLPAEIRASDLTGSTRAGLGALLQAADAVRGGTQQALAAIGDCRLGAPEGRTEQSNGDGAVAFVVGSQDVIAEIEAASSVTREFFDSWRMPGERFARSWEERFALTQAYGPLLSATIRDLLTKAKVGASDLAKVVIDAPIPRAVDDVVRALKIEPSKLADSLALTVGQTGAAHAGLMLAQVLPGAKPGDLILVACAADGADALLLRVTPAIARYKPARSVGQMIESKGDVSYAGYLKWREILPTEPPRLPNPKRPAAPRMLRSERWKYGLVGSWCKACGTPQIPPQRVCFKCRAYDQMEPYPFADRSARVATYAIDRLAYSPNPPTVNVVLDFVGGGRFVCEMTDCEPDKIVVGEEAEMTFRRLFTSDGVHNYFWKARPKR